MKVFYACSAVVEECNGNYYSNTLATAVPRYKQFATDLMIACYIKHVKEPSNMEVPLQGVTILPLHKINTLEGLVLDSRKNKQIIKYAVKGADCCICHVPADGAILAAKYARKRNIPALMVVVGCPWDALWNYGTIKGKLMAPLGYLRLRTTMKRATHSIYVTEKFLQERYPTAGKSVGCSDVLFKDFDDATLANRLDNIDKIQTTHLATMGALIKYKGQKKVIKAISLLAKEGLKFEYHIVGTGSQDDLLNYAESLGVAENIIFHGNIPHDAVFEILDHTDIYIQPSDLEGMPRALLEAMSRACPAIGTRVGGIPEILPEDMIFGKNDIQGLCNCLKRQTKQRMSVDAKRNYERAKDFELALLNKRRNAFINEFLNDFNLIQE